MREIEVRPSREQEYSSSGHFARAVKSEPSFEWVFFVVAHQEARALCDSVE